VRVGEEEYVFVEEDHEFEGGIGVHVMGYDFEGVLQQHDELVCSDESGEPFHEAVEELRRTKES